MEGTSQIQVPTACKVKGKVQARGIRPWSNWLSPHEGAVMRQMCAVQCGSSCAKRLFEQHTALQQQ